MTSIHSRLLIASCVMLMSATSASAQSWNAEQTAAWQAAAKTWAMDQNQDSSWMTTMTADNVTAWNTGNPAPRGRAAMVRWREITSADSKMLAHELAPQAIAVSDRTAVVHYYWSTLSEGKDGKRKTEHGYCSDTLIKRGDSWVFLGWNCGEIPGKASSGD